MSDFYIIFEGRESGAIGILEFFEVSISAESYDEALKKLYDNFEHIRIINWRLI